jgi:hypothetical protein
MDLRILNSHLTKEYLDLYGTGKTFIETGTYLGDTTSLAVECGYEQVFSCELNEELYESACRYFKGNPKVKLWHGDSIDCIPKMLGKANGPATFWLDAHASGPLGGGRTGGSPVLDELILIRDITHSMNAALNTDRSPTDDTILFPLIEHTIFIDDRRLFGSAEWSGVQEKDALTLLKEIHPDYKIHYLNGHIEGDVICATMK